MTLYRFHGRITVEREESLSHLLYERMSIMYKVELKFDTSKLAPETVNQMCEQADQIFGAGGFKAVQSKPVWEAGFILTGDASRTME